VSGAWWARVTAHCENPTQTTVIFNEPNFASQDNLDAEEAARIVREDWIGRIHVYDPQRGQGQPARLLPVRWCGLNVMAGVESSRRWLRTYRDAGGPEPMWHGVHVYPSSKAELFDWLDAHAEFLDSLGWHNPIVATEVGPRPNSDASALDVLSAAFRLGGRVAGWAWFSAHYAGDSGIWQRGDLLRADGSLTLLGEAYRSFAGRASTADSVSVWLPTVSA
jgi:hypothetical protein